MKIIENLYVIVPAFNEENSIVSVINDLQKYFKNIVVVDDGSTDSTTDLVTEMEVLLIRKELNEGQGAAIRTGLNFCIERDVPFMATFDSDGQHSAIDLYHMYEFLIENDLDVVLGSRFLGKALGISSFKYGILKLAVIVEKVLYGIEKTDAHNGLRVLNYNAALNLDLSANRMSHGSIIISSIVKNKLKFKEFPVTIKYDIVDRPHKQKAVNAIFIFLKLLFLKFFKSN